MNRLEKDFIEKASKLLEIQEIKNKSLSQKTNRTVQVQPINVIMLIIQCQVQLQIKGEVTISKLTQVETRKEKKRSTSKSKIKGILNN